MPVSRLFVEVTGQIDRMNQSLREAMTAADQAGIKVTGAGKSMIATFDQALNPTKALAEQVKLLETVGKSSADIWTVYGEKLKAAADAAAKNKQSVDPLVQSLINQNKAVEGSRGGFESLGASIQNFAQNPVQAAKAGVTGLLEGLGPTAVGIGAVGGAAIAAGLAIFEFTKHAAEAAEQIKNLSYATGMSTEQVQALQRLGEERGLGDLTATVEKLNVQLGKGQGGDFTEAILRMNIAIKQGGDAVYYIEEMRKHYRALADQIGETAAAQQMAADVGRRLVAILGPLLMSEESVTGQLKEIGSSGAVMSDDLVKKLAELHRKIEEHGRSWEMVKNKAVLYWDMLIEKITDFHAHERMYAAAMNQGVTTGPQLFSGITTGPQLSAPSGNELVRRQNEMAAADAIAAGTKEDLIGLTVQLNELERQYNDIKKDAKGLQFDAQALDNLARRIASTKELIKESQDADKYWVEQSKKAEEAQKRIKELNQETAKILQNLERKSHAALLPSGQEIDAYLKKFDEGVVKQLNDYQAVEDQLQRVMTSAGEEHLRIEKEISDTVVPRNESEKETIAVQKIEIAAQLQADAIRLKYAQLRYELEEKLSKLTPGSTLYEGAVEDMKKLSAAMDQALQDSSDLASAKITKVHQEAYNKMVDSVKQGAGQVFDAILARGKGAFQSLSDWIEGFFMTRLKVLFENLIVGIMGGFRQGFAGLLAGFTPGIGGGGTGGFSLGGVLGGLGGAAMAGIPSLGLMGATSSNLYLKGLGFTGLGITGGAVATSLITGMGISTAPEFLMAALTNPWTAAIAGGVLGTIALVKGLQGKNAYQAGAPEMMRDLGVSVSTDTMKQIYGNLGLSESQAYGIRKDIEISPVVLQQMGALAQQQGTYDTFLKKLQAVQTSWGPFDFSKAFQLGQTTGDWSELNKEFEDAFEHSQKLAEIMPDWKQKLEAVSTAATDAAGNVDPLTQALTDFRDAINGSITPVETMYDTFLKTGEITEELKKQIEDLGGSVEDLQKLSDMNLQLTGLQQSLSFIDSLTSSIKGLAPELDPINQLLSGQIGPELVSALTAAGLDPAKFTDLAGMIGLEKNWSNIAKPFGALTDQLRDALLKYGGEEGKLAVERYGQGFNTITQSLLDKTKAAMDQAYQQTVQDALKYLGDQAKETSDKISKLIEAIDRTKSDIVSVLDGILGALTKGGTSSPTTPVGASNSDAWAAYYAAVQAWQAQLQQILDQGGPWLAQEWENQNPPPQPPAADTGGLIYAHDGEAVLDRQQTSNLLRGQGQGITVNMSFPGAIITGVSSAADFVRQCLVELKRRGVKIENPGY